MKYPCDSKWEGLNFGEPVSELLPGLKVKTRDVTASKNNKNKNSNSCRLSSFLYFRVSLTCTWLRRVLSCTTLRLQYGEPCGWLSATSKLSKDWYEMLVTLYRAISIIWGVLSNKRLNIIYFLLINRAKQVSRNVENYTGDILYSHLGLSVTILHRVSRLHGKEGRCRAQWKCLNI